MADTLTVSDISGKVTFRVYNDTVLVPIDISKSISLALAFADGTGADESDKIYVAQRTLAAVTSENLDLAGSLVDPLGQTLTFVEITAIIIHLQADPAAGPLLIGGASSNGFANWITSAGTFATDQPQVRVRNSGDGGIFMLTGGDATGFAVTAATGDILKITNSHASLTATYNAIIVGRSA